MHPEHAIPQRFPKADHVLVHKIGHVLKDLTRNENGIFLLIMHNYKYDLSLLKELSNTSFGFIGILGPAQNRDRILADIKEPVCR